MVWTLGSVLFYGGLIGTGVTLIATVITTFVLGRSRSRLRAKLDEEYGKSRDKLS